MTDPAAIPPPRTLESLIEARAVGWRQGLVVALVTAALVLDGLDLIMLAFVAPIMIKEWQVAPAMFGYALSAALVTMTIGAFFGGRWGDRFGRKTVLLASVTGFALATLAVGFVRSVPELIALRLIGGLGFGAATPNGLALAVAWLPRRFRPHIAAVISVASPLGGIVAGCLTLWLVKIGGWRICFEVSGLLALGIAVAILFAVPESIDFALRRGRDGQAAATLRRMFGGIAFDPAALRPRADLPAPRGIFHRDLARLNLGLAIGFGFCSYVTFAFSSWTTTLLGRYGLSFEEAARAYLGYNYLAVASALAMPPLVARLGSQAAMAVAAATSLAMIALLAATHFLLPDGPILLFRISVAGIGFGQGLFNAIFYAVVSQAYLPAERASGSGYAMMVNRAGGVVAIVASGFAINAGTFGTGGLYLIEMAAALAVALAGTTIIDRHLAARRDRAAAPSGRRR